MNGVFPDVSRETRAKLARYVKLLLAENLQQNLVSRGTLEDLWQRHIVDSAQLTGLVSTPEAKCWADVGSGAGLPGLVIAILTSGRVALIEPRRLRADFLQRAANDLELRNVSVIQAKAQAAVGRFDVITARAVAKTGEILGITRHLAHKDTTYLLMKGRTAQSELDAVRRSWHGGFELVPSITDPEAGIIVASNVSPRGGK
jgi:16S rRNA (guanine527-N7)-methyltransferase